MRQRCSLILVVLAIVTMVMVMGGDCNIGTTPDGNPDCLFLCGWNSPSAPGSATIKATSR